MLSYSQNTTVRFYLQNMDMYYNSELHHKPTNISWSHDKLKMYFSQKCESILEDTCHVLRAAHCLNFNSAKVCNVMLSYS